jgi:hypothetical protein
VEIDSQVADIDKEEQRKLISFLVSEFQKVRSFQSYNCRKNSMIAPEKFKICPIQHRPARYVKPE